MQAPTDAFCISGVRGEPLFLQDQEHQGEVNSKHTGVSCFRNSGLSTEAKKAVLFPGFFQDSNIGAVWIRSYKIRVLGFLRYSPYRQFDMSPDGAMLRMFC